MSARSKSLYERLQHIEAIGGLIGTVEDADVEFKEWRGRDTNVGFISKAACGFANATGGVLLLGLKVAKDHFREVDVATELCPVEQAEAVRSAALEIIPPKVDPGFTGIQSAKCCPEPGSTSGFVILHNPEAALVRRVEADKGVLRKDRIRIDPMEMFQIADRSGRRPSDRLTISIAEINYDAVLSYGFGRYRSVELLVTNEGRGMAQYPTIFF